jgi:hypothetical protein
MTETLPTNTGEDIPGESLRNILPINFCRSSIPSRINKLLEARAKLITELHAINTELATLDTLNQIVSNGKGS